MGIVKKQGRNILAVFPIREFLIQKPSLMFTDGLEKRAHSWERRGGKEEETPANTLKYCNLYRQNQQQVPFVLDRSSKCLIQRLLTDEELDKLGVHLMPGYKDPYHKRPMKRGEIGCFLSHYNIWQEVARENYSVAMILEDDVRFEPFFNQKLISLLEELSHLTFEWDLVYLGRKRLDEKGEDPVENSKHLVWAGYSYWTLGYLLSGTGARKLIAQNPLRNILPVDEYLPIVYDKHPEDDWKEFFPIRDLIALSVEPLILYPAWYLHEEGYVSDTEDSPMVTTHRSEL